MSDHNLTTTMATTPEQEQSSALTSVSGEGRTSRSSSTDYEAFLKGFGTFEAFNPRIHALGAELGVEFQDLIDISDGGTNYRTVSLTIQRRPNEAEIPDGTQAILHIPRLIFISRPVDQDPNDWTIEEFVDDAAVLELATKCEIQVPKMIAFGTKSDNALGLPYSLQTRLSGVPLQSVLEEIPMEGMTAIATELTEMLVRLQSVKFSAFGLPCQDHNTRLEEKLGLDLSDRPEVERSVAICGFPKEYGGPIVYDRSRPTLPVTSSLYDLLKAAIDSKFLPPREENLGGDEDTDAKAHEKLGSILQQMKAMGWFETNEILTTGSVLHHDDLMPTSILVEQRDDSSWHITGILDWEDAGSCYPPVLTQTPLAWLWDRIDMEKLPQKVLDHFDWDYDFMPLDYYKEVNPDHLTEEGQKIKEIYENILIKGIYEPQYREKAAEIYQDHAYGRGRWIRRIWRFAFEGIFMSGHYWRLERLRKDWAAYTHADLDSDLFDSDEDDSISYASNSTAVNDHESFETFQHKVVALAPELHVEFRDVERLKGGSYNRIVALTMHNPPIDAGLPKTTQAILRIPRIDEIDSCVDDASEDQSEHDVLGNKGSAESKIQKGTSQDVISKDETTTNDENPYAWFHNVIDLPEDESDRREILDEAAVLNLLVRSGLKVPKVLAFDITRDNALKFPYSLHTRIPGTSLSNVLGDMSSEEKVDIATELAHLLASLDTIRFAESGRLLYEENAKTTKLSLDLSKRTEIGENVVVRGFFRGSDMFVGRDRPTAPTTSSLYSLLSTHIDDQIQYNKSLGPSEQDPAFIKLQAMLQDMRDMNWFASDDGKSEYSIVHHWDFEPRNVMVELDETTSRWTITGLIDWDDTQCLPPVLTRKPPLWLWDFSDDDLLPSAVQKYYDDDLDMMPLEYYTEINDDHLAAENAKVKERFEQVMADKIYSQRYGARAMEVYQDDAYGRGRWHRRIWRFANEGIFSSPNHDDRFEQLLKEWAEFKQTGFLSHETVFGTTLDTTLEDGRV